MRHGLRSGDPGLGAWWRGRHARRSARRRCDVLADECAAFLDGTYGAVIERGRWLREPWTWVNELAHAGIERLEAVADPADAGTPSAWDEVVAYLAVEILAGVGHDPAALTAFQQQYLVPLESSWAFGAPGQTPVALVAAVRAALARSCTHGQSDGT